MQKEIVKNNKYHIPITSDLYLKIIEFCNHFVNNNDISINQKPLQSSFNDIVNDWYIKFFDIEKKELFSIIMTANFLQIEPLLDITLK